MAAYIDGLIAIYRHIDFVRLDSYDMEQTGKYTVCCFATLLLLTILCCSVPIVFFSGKFWLPKTIETMAVIASLIAAYYWDVAAEMKQFSLHKLQIQNSHVWAVFGGQKITFFGSLWQLDFLSAYGIVMTIFWQLFTASFYVVSSSFTPMIISTLYADCRVTSMI
jgi:hypothetical protein